MGGRYVTDENGTISVSLEPGEYYFEESSPAPGFAFDNDEKGQQLTRYPFTVTGEETEAVVVTAYNIRLQGALTIEKTGPKCGRFAPHRRAESAGICLYRRFFRRRRLFVFYRRRRAAGAY
ncbi:MAG: collagen binding domain-containing protein [Clostridia bacterium]